VSFILNIDTAVQTASVCLSDDDKLLGTRINPTQKDHASWLHIAIKELLEEHSIRPGDLKAVGISAGPGSYTGLRVGMATAKGLCYSLQIPLISINTLRMMASAARGETAELLCPMIDARRMEVFTAIFNQDLQEIMPSSNLILDEMTFSPWLEQQRMSFFGNGSNKLQSILKHKNAIFSVIEANASHLAPLSYEKFRQGDYADLAYSEPFYGKDFHSTMKQSL